MVLSIIHIIVLTLLPTALFSSKVVTGLDCEVEQKNSKDWGATWYGKDGGNNGGWGKIDGRLFEFDCQTDHCYDSHHQRGDHWVTCGYSWKDSEDIHDSDKVIVNVRTMAYDDKDGEGTECGAGYKRALDIDATGNAAKDTSGNWGWHGFYICYETETWSTVREDRLDVVTDLYCGSSSRNPGGWTFLGQWDTHDNSNAKGYGDGKRTGHELYLWSKKDEPSLPVKTIAYWEAETRSRLKVEQPVEITKRALSSGTEISSSSEMSSWEHKVSKSHNVEVSANVKGVVKAMKLGLGARYNYASTEEHSESFSTAAWQLSKKTFQQEMEITKKFIIPAQVPGEPLHSNIWYFRTHVIDKDLTYADHFSLDTGFETDGPCYDVSPNCLPGYCQPFDPHCFTCTQDWAKIDPDFVPPTYCDGCPAGFSLVFDVANAECQQNPRNDAEYGKTTGQTLESCASQCNADSNCYAFDFKSGNCYMNSRCDIQETGTGYIACKKDDDCPAGFTLTFPGKPDGECQQDLKNDGEYGKTTGQTLESCASLCNADSSCYAIDFADSSCYMNTRCDFQDEGDGYRSCKKISTSESESAVSKMKIENKRLRNANEALRKALKALAN